jgi:hypothetical protein
MEKIFEKPVQNQVPHGQSYPLKDIPPIRQPEMPTIGGSK